MLTPLCPLHPYSAPSSRVVEVGLEWNFLMSNTEPIEGKDDPEIDW